MKVCIRGGGLMPLTKDFFTEILTRIKASNEVTAITNSLLDHTGEITEEVISQYPKIKDLLSSSEDDAALHLAECVLTSHLVTLTLVELYEQSSKGSALPMPSALLKLAEQ